MAHVYRRYQMPNMGRVEGATEESDQLGHPSSLRTPASTYPRAVSHRSAANLRMKALLALVQKIKIKFV